MRHVGRTLAIAAIAGVLNLPLPAELPRCWKRWRFKGC